LAPESKAARKERRKAAAATLNAIGVAAFVGSGVLAFLGQAVEIATILLGVAIFVGTQGALHSILRGVED